MAKYFFYLFLLFVGMVIVEFFEIYDIPYFEIPDWVSGTEEILQQTTQDADKIE